MATPTTVLWNRDPHTAAKHAILNRYLAAWFPIITRSFPDKGLTFVDAFAGPGEYDDGSYGSPMIALRHAYRSGLNQYRAPIRLLFIESVPKRCHYLRNLVAAKYPEDRHPAELTMRIVCGECGDKLVPGLADIGAVGAPIFANFDGWGVDTPLRLVKHVGRMPSAEVMITFATQHFVRFAKLENVEAGDRVFGGRDWRDLVHGSTSPGQKKRRLVTRYRELLDGAGFPFVLTFELVDEGGNAFLLIYGTSSEVGVDRMKDAMWHVDNVAGGRFRDPRDINQTTLEIVEGPDLGLLESQILGALADASGSASLAELKRFALLETIFKQSHATTAARNLEDQRKVTSVRRRSHEDTLIELAPLSLF